MRRGRTYPLFSKSPVQRPGVQKLQANPAEQENRTELHWHRYSEGGKNAGSHPVTALIVFRFDDNRTRDIDGAVSTVLDSLVRAGYLKDDDTSHLSGVCATSVKVPKGQSGVDVTLVRA